MIKGLFKFLMWLVFLAAVGCLVAWYFFDMTPMQTYDYVMGKSKQTFSAVKSESSEMASTAKNIPGIQDRHLNRAIDRVDGEF